MPVECALPPAFSGEGVDGCADPSIELRTFPVLCFVVVSLEDIAGFSELAFGFWCACDDGLTGTLDEVRRGIGACELDAIATGKLVSVYVSV